MLAAEGRLISPRRRRPPRHVGPGARPGDDGVPRPDRAPRARVGGRHVDRPARDRGVLHAGQPVRLGMGLAHYDGNTTLCMAFAVAGYKLSFGTDGPRLLRRPGARRRPRPVGRQRRQPPAAHAAGDGEGGPSRIVATDPRDEDRDDRRHPPPARPRRRRPAQRRVEGAGRRGPSSTPRTCATTSTARRPARAPARAWSVERGRGERHRRRRDPRPGPHDRRCRALHDRRTMGVEPLGAGHPHGHAHQHDRPAHRQPGRPGAFPFSITGHRNAMGTRESGFTASMPGYRGYDDPAARAELAALWGIDEARLPAARGKAYPDIVTRRDVRTRQGPVDHRHQPTRVLPQPGGAEIALRRLDLLVVQDAVRHPDDGARRRRAARRRARRTAPTRTASAGCRVQAAVAPPGEARSDFSDLPRPRRALGRRDELFPGWADPADALAEWKRASAGRPCDYSGITYDRIDRAGGVFWPCPEGDDVPLGARPGSTATGRSTARTGGPWCCRSSPSRSATRRAPSTRSCSTRDAPSSTGTPAPRPAASRSSRGCRPRRGSRCTRRMPPAWACGAATGCVAPRGRRRSDPSARDRHRPARRGVHPVPLGRAPRQPAHRRPVRPDQPRAQISQAVRGQGRTPPDPVGR